MVEEYSDDSYGDLIDTLPLLGRDLCKKVIDGVYCTNDAFMRAIGGEVGTCWGEQEGADQFFLHGEEYVSTALNDSVEEYFYKESRNLKIEKPQEHEFV